MATCVLKIPVTLTIEVPDVDAQLALTYEHIRIERSENGETGTYTEITDASTRPLLVSGTTSYEYVDTDGSPSFWYRFRYGKADDSLFSAYSDAFLGGNDPALDLLSVCELKNLYLFGVDLTNDAGEAFPDTLFAHAITAAVSWLEHQLDIAIRPITLIEERHDYFKEDFNKYMFVETDLTPVIQIDEFKMVLAGENTVQTFDRSWIHLDRMNGQIQVVPGSGTAGAVFLGAGSPWLPLSYGTQRFMPDVFRVSYKAGFGKPDSYDLTPGEYGPVSNHAPRLESLPTVIKDVVGKLAAFAPLNIAGDLIVGAGIAASSLSLDSLSQSISTTSSATNAGYGARLVQYSKELKEAIPALKRYYKGLKIRVV